MASGQIKNTFTSLGEVDTSLMPSSLVLKLTLNNQFLRYFVYSTLQQSIIYLGDYALHHVTGYDDLKQRVEKIYAKDEVLQLPFGEKLLGTDAKYSLMPDELLFMAVPRLSIQKCEGQRLNMVYESNPDMDAFVQQLFPGIKTAHLNSTFINLLPGYFEDGQERLFINLSSGYFDVIKFNYQNQLLLMTRYWFVTDTDFAYYLALCCDELGMDREKTVLVLMGDIERKSKVYDMCYKYFRHQEFISKPDNIDFSKAFEAFPVYRHFNLYNLKA